MHPPVRSSEDMSLHLALLVQHGAELLLLLFSEVPSLCHHHKTWRFVDVKLSLCPKGVSHTVPAEQILWVGRMKDLLEVLSPDWDHGMLRLWLRLLFSLCSLSRPFTHIAGSFHILHNPKSIANSGTEWSWASWRALNNFSPTQTWHMAESSHIVFLQESFLDPLLLLSLSWQSALWTRLALTFHLLENLCSNLNRSWSAHSMKKVFGGCSGELNGLECQLCPQPLGKSPC